MRSVPSASEETTRTQTGSDSAAIAFCAVVITSRTYRATSSRPGYDGVMFRWPESPTLRYRGTLPLPLLADSSTHSHDLLRRPIDLGTVRARIGNKDLHSSPSHDAVSRSRCHPSTPRKYTSVAKNRSMVLTDRQEADADHHLPPVAAMLPITPKASPSSRKMSTARSMAPLGAAQLCCTVS